MNFHELSDKQLASWVYLAANLLDMMQCCDFADQLAELVEDATSELQARHSITPQQDYSHNKQYIQ
jgi:hypothetical protein